MLTLGINQFIRNFSKNIMAIIQLILIYLVAIFTVSSSLEQLSLWKGVSDYIDETGVVLWTRHFSEDANLYEILTKVEKVDKKYSFELSNANAHYSLVAVSSEYNHYEVPLIEGEGCDSGRAKEGVIRVVVSNEFTPRCTIGEELVVDGVTLKIVGIYDSKELLYKDSPHGSDISYLDFYSAENKAEGIQGKNNYRLLASYEDLFRELKPYSVESIIVDYEDDITIEEMENNERILNAEYRYIKDMNMHYTNEIYDYSMQLLQIKLVPMILIFVIALIFAIISVVTSGVITVYSEQRTYGIYFVCGNSWNKTIFLSVVHWCFVAILSLFAALCIYTIIGRLSKRLALEYTEFHAVVLGIIVFLTMVMSVILPYGILKKMQPINIIRNNM